MLRRLRAKLQQRGLAADVYEMDVRELALPQRFDLIMIPFHASAELPRGDDQRRTLSRIRDHLTSGAPRPATRKPGSCTA